MRYNSGLYFRACSFVGNYVLIFPFVSFKRQCQLNNNSVRYHITPITAAPMLFNYFLSLQNGPLILRGVSSFFLWRASSVVAENLLKASLSLSDEITCFSFDQMASHLLLKSLAILITSPFYIVHLIDSVKSESTSLSELAILIKDTFQRIFTGRTVIRSNLLFQSSIAKEVSASVRMLRPMPYFYIVPLASGMLLGMHVARSLLLHLLFKPLCSRMWISYKHRYNLSTKDDDTVQITRKNKIWYPFFVDMCASILSDGIVACIFYPLDTLICRLAAQGCRVIIDDTDHGVGVLPVATYYESLNQCAQSVFNNEAVGGFFKGFGYLTLQIAAQAGFVYYSQRFLIHILDKLE
ncbi:hypothetical protein GJ496_007524 [Pomphorhynchus laevis]|nr:hypothetical protein GJ496_007524 [Pomphorhynchus laevis]